MAHDKLLAEWFWIDRWVGSSAFALPIDARGLYREMLTQAWRRGATLPNDPQQIRRMCGVTMREWKRLWPQVRRYWRVTGRAIVNETQREVYAEARSRADAASRKASIAATKRWKRSTAQGVLQALPGAVPEECPPITVSDQDLTQTLSVPERAPCTYCGATAEQTRRAMEWDHFVPRAAGGSNDPSNLVLACHVCNQAKANRLFDTLDEARMWLHHAYWTSKRQRWVAHRAIAFGGQPPADLSTPSATWECPHVDRCTNRIQCGNATAIGRPRRDAS